MDQTPQQLDRSDAPMDPMTQQIGDSTTQPLNQSTKSWHGFVYYWLPALCWMAVIFVLSSFPGSPLLDMGPFDFAFKKTAHVVEYAILYFLLFRAFHSTLPSRKAFIFSAIIGVLYAISDEYHQTFVPLREGRVRDVIIDSVGFFLMYLFLGRKHLP
jgi:VanZ family protein